MSHPWIESGIELRIEPWDELWAELPNANHSDGSVSARGFAPHGPSDSEPGV